MEVDGLDLGMIEAEISGNQVEMRDDVEIDSGWLDDPLEQQDQPDLELSIVTATDNQTGCRIKLNGTHQFGMSKESTDTFPCDSIPYLDSLIA